MRPPCPPKVLSYLPYAVYSFFQNGGRFCWIIRSAPTTTQGSGHRRHDRRQRRDHGRRQPDVVRHQRSLGGHLGQQPQVRARRRRASSTSAAATMEDIFAIQVLLRNTDGDYETVETFRGLSVTGNLSGTRRVDSAINDLYAGQPLHPHHRPQHAAAAADRTPSEVPLAGGVDPGHPRRRCAARLGAARSARSRGRSTSTSSATSTTPPSSTPTRWRVHGSARRCPARASRTVRTSSSSTTALRRGCRTRTPSDYATTIQSSLGANLGDSY